MSIWFLGLCKDWGFQTKGVTGGHAKAQRLAADVLTPKIATIYLPGLIFRFVHGMDSPMHGKQMLYDFRPHRRPIPVSRLLAAKKIDAMAIWNSFSRHTPYERHFRTTVSAAGGT